MRRMGRYRHNVDYAARMLSVVGNAEMNALAEDVNWKLRRAVEFAAAGLRAQDHAMRNFQRASLCVPSEDAPNCFTSPTSVGEARVPPQESGVRKETSDEAKKILTVMTFLTMAVGAALAQTRRFGGSVRSHRYPADEPCGILRSDTLRSARENRRRKWTEPSIWISRREAFGCR